MSIKKAVRRARETLGRVQGRTTRAPSLLGRAEGASIPRCQGAPASETLSE